MKIFDYIKRYIKRKNEPDLIFNISLSDEELERLKEEFNEDDDKLWENSMKYIDGVNYYKSLGYKGHKLKEALDNDPNYNNLGCRITIYE